MEKLFGNKNNMRVIGRGKGAANSVVKTNSMYAYKYTKSRDLQELVNEKKITERAASLGVAPPLMGSDPIVILEAGNGQWAMRIRMKKLKEEKDSIKAYAKEVSGGRAAIQEIQGYISILNSHGICHGDIHKYNIMRDSDRLYIIDYGLARKANTVSSSCTDMDSFSSIANDRAILKIQAPNASPPPPRRGSPSRTPRSASRSPVRTPKRGGGLFNGSPRTPRTPRSASKSPRTPKSASKSPRTPKRSLFF